MTKEELYNKILKLVQTTGQGVPHFVIAQYDEDIVDELLNDNKIKIVKTEFSYLPNNITYCLSEGYCVEEANNSGQEYNFIREYLGIEHEIMPNVKITIGQMLRCEEDAWITWKNSEMLSQMQTRKDFEETSNLTIEKYYTWLMKNQQAINTMLNLEPMEPSDRILSDKDKEWIISRDWFKITDINSIVKDINIGNNKNEENISICKQIISLSEKLYEKTNDKSSLKTIEDNKEDIENKKYNIKLRNYVLSKLKDGKSLEEILK